MVDLLKHTAKPAKPDVTPLLDVVFILLIFFVISAVFTARGMEVELPEAVTASPVTGRSLEIDIKADGQIICDGERITLHDLKFILRNAAEAPVAQRPAQILLKASPKAEVGSFVRAMDLVRENGFENLVIATKNTTGNPQS